MAQPLIKIKSTGALYAGPASVEAAIDVALGQDWAILAKRVYVRGLVRRSNETYL